SARRTGWDPAPGAGLTSPLLHASSLPWPVVGAERRLAAFGKAGERAAPLLPHLEVPARGGEGVQRLAPGPRHLLDVGGASLAALDLDRGVADLRELRDQVDGVQARRLLDRMQSPPLDDEAALAQGRVAGALVGLEAVDQHLVEPRAEHLAVALPAHRAGRRAGATLVGRFPGDVGRQVAPALGHDAQAAEAED